MVSSCKETKADWVFAASHLFPLTWEFHFVRDIIARGAGFADISKEFGAFLLYMAVVLILFCAKFFSARRALLKRQAQDELHRQKMQQLSLEESAAAGQAE